MFKHEITYTDFNDIERKEDFYFHLSTPEVIRLEAEIGGEIQAYTERIAKEQNLTELLDFMEKLILGSYGKKTLDGKSFIKNKDLRVEFEYSQAYAEMFEEMIKNPDLARRFGEGVAEAAKHRKKKNTFEPRVVEDTTPE